MMFMKLKLRNGFFIGLFGGGGVFFEHRRYGILPPMPQMRDLEHSGHGGHDHAGGKQQIQPEVGPYPGVDRVVYFGDLL